MILIFFSSTFSSFFIFFTFRSTAWFRPRLPLFILRFLNIYLSLLGAFVSLTQTSILTARVTIFSQECSVLKHQILILTPSLCDLGFAGYTDNVLPAKAFLEFYRTLLLWSSSLEFEISYTIFRPLKIRKWDQDPITH